MGKLLIRMLREIKHNLGQFLSLVLVIAVGSFMFAGLFATIISIHHSVDVYYEEQDMPDVWARFNGIDDDTIHSLSVQMDMQAEGRYTRIFDATLNEEPIQMKLSSVTGLCAVRLKSGVMPQNEYEIVVDSKFARANSITTGESIRLEQPDGEVTLTVCGIGDSPENAWKVNNSTSGVVKDKTFAAGYTTADTMRTLIKNSEQYAQKYDELMEEFDDPQADLGEAKSDLMEKEQEYADGKADALSEIHDAKSDLIEAKDKLADAGDELDESKAEQDEKIADAHNELDDGWDTLADGQDELDDKQEEAEAKFNDLYGQIADAQKGIDDKQAQIDAGAAAIAQSRTQLTQQRELLAAQYDEQIRQAEESGAPQEEIDALEDAKEQALEAIDDGLSELDEQEAVLNASQTQLDDAQKELDAKKNGVDVQKKLADMEFKLAQSKLDNAEMMLKSQEKTLDASEEMANKQLDSAQKQLDEKTDSYESAVEKLEKQEDTVNDNLASSRESLDDVWETYYDKEQEFTDKKQEVIDELNDALLGYSEVLIMTDDPDAAVTMLSEQDHYVTSILREDQASAKAVQGGMDIVGIVSYVFPVVFFLIAALIAFISMSKMVENQRMQIAVMEAMGIHKGKILSGYLLYSLLASFLGSFGFAALGNRLIPPLLTHMLTNRYILPPVPVPMYWYLIVAPFVLGMLFSGAATVIAARSVFKEVPAQAMRPRPPKKSKPILLERLTGVWTRLSYASKLNCRNIFLNKKKILMSSVGVLGCVALVLMGLSIQTSAEKILQLYKDSVQYDLQIQFEDKVDYNALNRCPYPIAKTDLGGGLRVTLPDEQDDGLMLQVLPAGSDMVRYHDQQGEDIKLTQTGVVIPRNVAEEYELQKGDTMKLQMDDTVFRVRVSAVAEQYAGGNSLISKAYVDALELEYTPDEAFLRLENAADTQAAQAYFAGIDTVKSVTSAMELSNSVRDSLEMLKVIVKVIIAAAAVLSVTVIYNITSIHIFERTRELATLMVLGYYKNEAGRLVFAENLVITGVGFVLGVPAGAALFSGVAQTFRNAGIHLPHGIELQNAVFALVLVYALSIMTNLLLKRRISRIDMVEALKGVE